MALTQCDLYRNGAGTSGKLDGLRSADVDIYADRQHQEICVRARKGISCWDDPAQVVVTGKLKRLPRGTYYDDTQLVLYEDFPGAGHWNWRPSRDMPGSEYLRALRAADAYFVNHP
jgi:hypothetical protein